MFDIRVTENTGEVAKPNMSAKAYLKLDDDRAGGATQIDLKPLIMSFAAVAWSRGRSGCHMPSASSASS